MSTSAKQIQQLDVDIRNSKNSKNKVLAATSISQFNGSDVNIRKVRKLKKKNSFEC